MFYHPQDYKFIPRTCHKWEFIKSTARLAFVDDDYQPVFKDCKGHFATLRKNNWTKFDKKSLDEFFKSHYDLKDLVG